MIHTWVDICIYSFENYLIVPRYPENYYSKIIKSCPESETQDSD